MSALAKVFVVFVFILSVAFFGASATLFKVRLDWKQAYLDLEAESNAQFKDLKERIETVAKLHDNDVQTISSLKTLQDGMSKEITSLTENIKEANKQILVARSQADNANSLNQGLKSTVDELRKDRENLETQLTAANQARETAQEESAQAKKERDAMRVDLDAAQIALHEARTSTKEMSDKIDTLELVVEAYEKKYGPMGAPTPNIDALVKAVDAKEGLVVLSVGEDDQVKLGHEFTVFRGDNWIGKVKVIRVYPNLAGARIEMTKDGEQVRIGDKASTRITGLGIVGMR